MDEDSTAWVTPAPDSDGLTLPPEDLETRVESVDAEPGAPMDAPSRIGRFVVVRLLGAGGMGSVFAAYDEQLDRRLAIKVINRGVDDAARRLVLREAKAMAKLSHPNVVQVFEVGEHDGRLFIAMEYIHGRTLAQWQKQPGRTWREILDVYLQVGAGLAAAHAAGLIHRDFKPHNAMVDDDVGTTRVRVLDFGLAQLAANPAPVVPVESLAATDPDHGADPRLTRTGALLGTPAYMAPEQFDGSSVTDAADQFSYCVSLWEGLYGARPFDAPTLGEMMLKIVEGQPDPGASRTSVPGWLHAAVCRGLALAPGDRHPSMEALLGVLRFDPNERRRRRLWIVAGVVAIGAGAAGIDAWTDAREERCSGAHQQLEGVWDAARRQQAKAAILETKVPYAQRAWEHAMEALDDYAARWETMHTEACEATTVRGELSLAVMDLRMACLRRGLHELDAAVDLFADADPKVVTHVADVVGGLMPLARCEDIEALQADVDPPTARERPAVESARAALALARGERTAGRLAGARDATERARSFVEGLEYRPIRSELAVEEGRLLADEGRFDEALAVLREGLRSATAQRQREQMGECATDLMYILGLELGRADEALQYRELALGLAEGNPDLGIGIHNAIGTVLYSAGSMNEAEVAFRETAELAELVLGEHPRLAMAWNNIAAARVADGDYAEGLEFFNRALELRTRLLGPEHPAVGSSRNNIGHTLISLRKYARAEEEFRAALAIREAALGPDHPRSAETRANLGVVFDHTGRHAEAEAAYRAAIAGLERSHGADSPRVAVSRNNLGQVLMDQGKLEEAETVHRKALQVRLDALGPDHPDVAESRSNLALVLLARGRPAEAVEAAELAYRVRREHGAPEFLATTTFALARALVQADPKQTPRARKLAQEAIDALDRAQVPGDAQADTIRAWLAAHP